MFIYETNWFTAVDDRKINFLFLPKAERKSFKKVPFCRNTERGSFCRKRVFLPKEGLSSKNLRQFWNKLRWIRWFLMPKQAIYAAKRPFCQNKLFLQKHQKAKLKQKEFLPNFCQNFRPKGHRNALSVAHCFEFLCLNMPNAYLPWLLRLKLLLGNLA